MDQVIQLVGAASVLAAFIAVQARRMSPASRSYLALNAVGAGILAASAVAHQQWGFLLLEGVWALVALAGLVRTVRR